LFARLDTMNIHSISINWLINTDNIHSNVVTRGPTTPSNEAIILFAQKAITHGFTVGFRPIIDETTIMRQGKNEWRGTIRPRDVSIWFQNYGTLIDEYGAIANANGVQFLVIGTELNSMENYPGEWLKVITSLRKIYTGQLTYSANQLISKTMPWQALDFISVDAFLKLDAPAHASVNQLIDAWQTWVVQITNPAKKLGLPVVFTEIGVASQASGYQQSWLWDHHTKVDLTDQEHFYQASCLVWKNKIAGLYWWVVEANMWMVSDPLQDSSFSPLGKPAEEALTTCFK
jgi:hypothetical protein